jgi:predicted PurR-regulated permease PerM
LGTASLVLVLVVFMLLERRDLRDRLLELFGHGRLAGRRRRLTKREPVSRRP